MTWRSIALPFVGLVWLGIVGVGFGKVLNHEWMPGKPGAPPEVWPIESGIQRTPGGYTLVMAAHPRCPCTRASLGELAWVMARHPGRTRAYVLFLSPPDASDAWTDTDLWRIAREIPGVVALADDEGRAAKRFGAFTSGQTMLYDPDGRLVFRGGLTASRGHSGESQGRDAVVSWIAGGPQRGSAAPVFGCSLIGDLNRTESSE